MFNLGSALWKLGSIEQAIAVLERAASADPPSIPALRVLTSAAIDSEDVSRAVAWHTKLTGTDYRDRELTYNIGVLLQQAGNHPEAERFYRMALENDSTLPEALLNLGHALDAQGRGAEAKSCWEKALAQKPELAHR
jgi:tetratricopeptide (TPR) repeat protein